MRWKWGVFLILSLVFGVSFAWACNPYWVQDPVNCLVNDSYIVSYHDMNSCNSTNVPIMNGTSAYCNFCNEDLQSTETNCIDFFQNISWVDNNFASCCSVTNIASDCDIFLTPYNETTTQNCYWSNITEELGSLDCQIQPNMGINEKEYCIAHIPHNYSNESFKCIAMIKNGLTDEIIQTTPQYKEMSQTFISFFPESDTRQWFTPANNIVNFYYTGKNLHPDNKYVLSIICSSQERTLTSQMPFDMAYEDMSFVFFRTRWIMSNFGYIITGFLILLIILILLFLWWKGVWG